MGRFKLEAVLLAFTGLLRSYSTFAGLALVAILLARSQNTWAACTTPALSGQIQYMGGNSMLYCNQTPADVSVAAVSTVTACSTAGNIVYSAGILYFCNGSFLYRMSNEGAQAPTACGALAVGGFYYSSGNSQYWYCGAAGVKSIP